MLIRIANEDGTYNINFICPSCNSNDYTISKNSAICNKCGALISLLYLILDEKPNEGDCKTNEK